MNSRRRFLTILAGAAALPVLGAATPAAAFTRWKGIALGANASIVLDHPDADRLMAKAVAEIRRLEAIFSLYQANSQISRLNRDGVLTDPSFEMIELLSLCATLHARTKGAFDPTVQTLWSLYARNITAGFRPKPNQIAQALNATGWGYVRYSTQQVRFTKKGVALTLNGIAQGFIADRVTALLRKNGVRNVLVNAGEIAAIGHAPDGDDWQVRLAGRDDKISLTNAAIATSALSGTTFDDDGKISHILDPRTGLAGGLWSQVSVMSGSAAEADGLSTAFCLLNQAEIMAAKGDAEVFTVA